MLSGIYLHRDMALPNTDAQPASHFLASMPGATWRVPVSVRWPFPPALLVSRVGKICPIVT